MNYATPAASSTGGRIRLAVPVLLSVISHVKPLNAPELNISSLNIEQDTYTYVECRSQAYTHTEPEMHVELDYTHASQPELLPQISTRLFQPTCGKFLHHKNLKKWIHVLNKQMRHESSQTAGVTERLARV